jgi:hypothetical protein
MIKYILLFLFLFTSLNFSQPFADQFYSYEKDSLTLRIESMNGTEISADGKNVILSNDVLNGTVIFSPDSSAYPFNRGLPSWNGHAPNNKSSFKVLMRYYKNGWSPWLTVGFWKENIWSSYGATTYSGGKIDYDYTVLNSYHSKWQFQVVMKRTSANEPSPGIRKLSFFVSDQLTTDNVNITAIVNDKPEALFIPTQHYYQYGLDPGIGGDICSPTSVAMVLTSYNIEVDPLQFAKDNYDPYWKIFGVWPRAVQNAAEFNLNGSVTRYRTWSEAREVLAAGGRIVMSVGLPLYAGHLMMLAGFDAQGNPLVHDPAKSNGYSYKFNKTSLSQSWFSKGGVSYTFFPEDTSGVTSFADNEPIQLKDHHLISVYPNPFNPQTNIRFQSPSVSYAEIVVYDIAGREIEIIYKDIIDAGSHNFSWNASNLPSGMYFIRLIADGYSKTIKAMLIK